MNYWPNSPVSQRWQPAMMHRLYSRRPEIGSLIGYHYRAWRVLDIRDVDRREGDVSYMEPYEVIVTPVDGDDADRHFGIRVNGFTTWNVLPEHYAVCHLCGDLAPCRRHMEAKAAEADMKRAVENMSLLDGACPACKEPITHRQKSHRFPGPNLLNPLGADVVQFHARRQCQGGAAEYEEKWVKADPTRGRSLLTLRCAGHLVVHQDGTAECFSRQDGSDCPTVYAHHQGLRACYVQSHGCGRGCPTEGHPGTRLAIDLTPEGYRNGLIP